MIVPAAVSAQPGQFLHVAPEMGEQSEYHTFDWSQGRPNLNDWTDGFTAPMLRRAYSVADLRSTSAGSELDIIYRVVGKGTTWLRELKRGDVISVLGPLGNSFPISATKEHAWLIAGGVGLPPMLWLAQFLHHAHKKSVLFYGAQTAELLAVRVNPQCPPDPAASDARPAVRELADWGALAIISTDDGSVGFHGHVGAALEHFVRAQTSMLENVVMYTCGPERMMRFVADFAMSCDVETYVCMERAMACGTGTCQSCVVPVRGQSEPDWRYSLCCTEGPVYPAESVIWDMPTTFAPVPK